MWNNTGGPPADLLAGLRSYPHVLGPETLHIRNDALHDIAIPWEDVSEVTPHDRSLSSSIRRS